jgi:hypothetical protein
MVTLNMQMAYIVIFFLAANTANDWGQIFLLLIIFQVINIFWKFKKIFNFLNLCIENFAQPSSDMNFQSVPIRAIFEGSRMSNGQIKPFKIQHEFYEFRTKIKDETVFLVI